MPPRGRDKPGPVALDDVSKAIVEQLQQDGRRSYADIGKHVGLSEAAVRQRVQRLLDDGVGVKLDPRWDAVVSASAALTATPSTFGATHIAALRAAGLDDAEIVDVINAAAFFNWANRLMLSLGEPAARD